MNSHQKAYLDGCRGGVFLGAVIVGMVWWLCSCAPHPVTFVPNIDTLSAHVDSVKTLAGHGGDSSGDGAGIQRTEQADQPVPRDSIQSRVPWSPTGKPVRMFVAPMEPGIYHGYWEEHGGVDSAGVRTHLDSPLSGPQVRRRYNTAEVNGPVCTDAGRGSQPVFPPSFTYPFLWVFISREYKPRYARFFYLHAMTGATLPAIPCTIEIRKTDGRP